MWRGVSVGLVFLINRLIELGLNVTLQAWLSAIRHQVGDHHCGRSTDTLPAIGRKRKYATNRGSER